jgi:hypothetical protein
MRPANYMMWLTGLCVLAFFAPITRAQQQPADTPSQSPSGPIPAYHSPLASAADNGQSDENSQELTPDTNSLSGAQLLTLGIPLTRSYWQPSFSYYGTADSNPVTNQGSGNTWTGWNTMTGEIDIHRTSGNNNLALSYVAGGMIGIGGPGEGGVIQELSAVDTITFRRWTLSLIEQLSYVPPSGIGVNGIGGGGIGGIGVPPLNPGLVPGQPFLTASGQTLSSSSDGEADVQLTRRTSLTFVGGYLLLKYFGNGNSALDYGGFNARAGYNYQWTRKDTLAVVYTYNRYEYPNSQQSIDSQSVQLSYARRVTGRLAFQAAAGPQFASFQQPIPTGSTTPPSSGTQLYWAANAGLQYQLKRGNLAAYYSHGVNGGSGVLAGAITDSVTGSTSRRLSRTLSGSISGGYYRNHGVALGTVSPPTTAQTYDYWSAGGTLSRAWGRSLNLNFSYQMQYQSSGAQFCVGATCGMSFFRNLVSVGVSWRDRPLLF